MPRLHKVVILHNIISPYKTLLFNAMNEVIKGLKVLYISETEQIRDWAINKKDLKFSYEVMFDIPADKVPLIKLFKETWRRLNKIQPEVLIIDGYSYSSCWAGLFWARKNKRKIILWSSSNEDDHKRIFYKELIKRFFVKRCDAANVYGTKSKEYLLKLGAKKDKVFIIGNNTDNDFYFNETIKLKASRTALCQRFGIPAYNFLYIGRFSPEKNLFFLLKCFKEAQENEKMKDWGLILVGDGPQKKEIENYVRDNNIKNVFFPGFKQKEEIPEYLAVSDVFILPSISEPWGLVVNEAMAVGLPVLVSRKCGCYPDLLKEGINGFSFNPFDKDRIISLMKEIAEEKYNLKKMGEASLDIIKDYTPQRAARVIKETIKFVLEENERTD